MNGFPGSSSGELTRRSTLAGLAGAAGLSTGCVSRARSLVNRDPSRQVELTVKTVPADDDPAATELGRRLVEHLDAAGIDARLVPMARSELLRDVLVNGDFDLYVSSLPNVDDPDVFRPLLHSQFVEEPGWQNPFGFADLTVDDLLAAQRSESGTARRTTVADFQRAVVRAQPFAPAVVADEVRAVRADRVDVGGPGLDVPLGYLALSAADGGGLGTFRVTRTDARVTRNLNPLAVEFRTNGLYTGLLYDPLARRIDGEIRPWLAESWQWTLQDDGNRVGTVLLRDDVQWHDGTPLDAADVAFTYRFLADTSLGNGDVQAPAPRFRGHTSLVESARTVDDRTVELSLRSTSPAVARRVLTVPVLPRHVWRERTGRAELAGVKLSERTTEALVWSNPQPVGSGPFRFVSRQPGRRLVLERVDDHFSAETVGLAPYERLVVTVVPSAETGLELLESGDAHLTATPLTPDTVPRAARKDALRLSVSPERTVYHVGFNARRSPLNNPRFRRTVARLLDKGHLARTAFRGYATPAVSPLAGTDWVTSELEWHGEDPEVPFLGADGTLDETAARQAFRDIGYEYGADGELLTG